MASGNVFFFLLRLPIAPFTKAFYSVNEMQFELSKRVESGQRYSNFAVPPYCSFSFLDLPLLLSCRGKERFFTRPPHFSRLLVAAQFTYRNMRKQHYINTAALYKKTHEMCRTHTQTDWTSAGRFLFFCWLSLFSLDICRQMCNFCYCWC